jgi:hypothetical protein
MPYLIQEPLDGYGACQGWVDDVVAAQPSLKTWNMTAQDATPEGFIRVDDIQFSEQIYNDLVNLYNNLVSTDPMLIDYWYGIHVSSLGSDHGAYPKLGAGLPTFKGGYMYGANSIYNFATSPLCVVSACAQLAIDALSVTNGTSLALINELNSFASQVDTYNNAELLLGLSYAAYNFSKNYLGGRPFVVLPSQELWLPSSQYPYPYNSTYIKGLNLLQKVEIGAIGYVDNGNQPTTQSVSSDLQRCSSNSPYGNVGAFLTANAVAYPVPTASYQWFLQYIINTAYYQAYCAATSMMEIGNLLYGNTSDQAFLALMQYGTLMNRLRNIGNVQIPSPSITASDPTTGLTLIRGNNVALAWFFTNKTSTEYASTVIDASSLGLTGPWLAISALDWRVVAAGVGPQISLSVSIPAQSWNPIYIVPQVQNLEPVYSNLPIVSYSISSSGASYSFSGPHDFSSWLVMSLASPPTSVVTSNAGSLSSFNTLSALNASFIGMKYTGGSIQNLTQTGYYYDQSNNLLYIHYVGDNNVTVTVNGQGTVNPLSASLSVSPTSGVANQTSFYFSATASGGSQPYPWYLFDFGDGSVYNSTSAVAYHTYSSSGSFTASVTVTDAVGSVATSYPLQVLVNPNTNTSSNQGDLVLLVNPLSASTSPGGTAEYTVQVNSTGVASESISLSLSSLPEGVTAYVQPSSGQTNYTSYIQLVTSPSIAPGYYSFSLLATGFENISILLSLMISSQAPGSGGGGGSNQTTGVSTYVLTLGTAPSFAGATEPEPGTYELAAGTQILLSANPYPGWRLLYWDIDGNTMYNATQMVLTMQSDHDVLAVFAQSIPSDQNSSNILIESNQIPSSEVTVDGVVYTMPVNFLWSEGSSHNLSVPSVVYLNDRTRGIFAGWSSSVEGGGPNMTITVTSDMQIQVNYLLQQLVSLEFVDIDGHPITPQNLILLEGSKFLTLNQSDVWLNSGEQYTLVSATWMGRNVITSNDTLRVTQAGTMILPLAVYDAEIRVVDLLGIPIENAHVSITLPGSYTFTNSTDSKGLVIFNDLPQGVFTAEVSYMGISSVLQLDGSSHQSYSIVLAMSFPVISTLIASSLAPVIYLFLRRLFEGKYNKSSTLP